MQPLDRMPAPLPGESHLHQLSRALQALLRHRATATGVSTNPGGWADYEDVLALPWVRLVGATPDTLDALVANRYPPRAPGRFQSREVNGRWQIRATQGHTMEHVRLEEVGTRILPSDASQSRVLYHFVSMTVWQSGILDRGLAPCGSRRHRVVFFSPNPDPAGPGWRAFPDTVVIAVDAAEVHRLGLPVYLSCEGDTMIAGSVPPTAWLWAVRYQPDGVRVRLWQQAPLALADAGAAAGSASPRARRRAAGARRAADCGPSPSSGRRRSASRAPPPPRDGEARKSPPGSRLRSSRGDNADSRSVRAGSRMSSQGPPASTYTSSESPSGTRWPDQAHPDPGRRVGSQGSGSDRLSGRGVYASGRMHHHLPAPDLRTPQSPPRRLARPRSPAPRSRSRLSRNRAVVLAAPRGAPDWAVDPAQIWVPGAPARSEPPAAATGRSRSGTRPKPTGAPRRTNPARRSSHHERRRRRRADGD